MWEAKAYTPQGIIEGNETKDLLLKDDFVETIPYQWNGFNKKLGGIRKGELILLQQEVVLVNHKSVEK